MLTTFAFIGPHANMNNKTSSVGPLVDNNEVLLCI